MIIRTATIDDLPQIAAVESECFPPAEAATKLPTGRSRHKRGIRRPPYSLLQPFLADVRRAK